MAIFSRRTIQRLIIENAAFLSRKQIKLHVDKLNNGDLSAEWEVILLNAFGKLGKVVHEPKFKGTNPDIHFTSYIDRNQSFIADIATLSDRGIKQKYPAEDFYNRLMEFVRQRGLSGDSFSLQIDTDYSKVFRGGANPTLKLPTQPNFDKAVFNENFHAFLDEIVTAPNELHRYVVQDEKVGILIIYSPSKGLRLPSMSHLSYTVMTSLIQNTIYNRLQEKAYKLVNADSGQPSGLIVCDGGYSLFNKDKDGYSYGFNEVIQYLLEEYPAISFILTFSVSQRSHDTPNTIKMRLYQGLTFDCLGAEILKSIDGLDKVLPIPQLDARNAVYLLKAAGKTHKGDSFWGGTEVSSNEIKISARVVLDLLAGKITQETFSRIYGFTPTEGEHKSTVNIFTLQVEDGRLIKGIKLEKGENEKDDDWLIFKFGEPDPAITPYTVPKENKP